ncbi:AbrB/MazE/SpoVT family DNA-binding domain-containing protein [Clostridium saccharobutylicum]|uniref:Transcriptional regulator, AbrB family n=1 Tax=Clostridium saccharobutylicum DSM 13864 TaxID=1345695 RepID=U5MKZ8_CLOSA|nr:AbrB/MazE/SpoVT family DNA-binding domain-containing protein [Clostridium saccharobutylicum]AGX41449.1 transcriptional regulator, AbrB family [Clostridium saccharobutylicum DSM 13864]AQR88730.1 stage V sporulation protein T [Clostridium saccharobutylicum]AQR98628.1 stage V sporulation protein T [Clostridium saccharobutylicum]AQS12618.1 stage V sporulation protein T [Clostridium saccharobutylicum]MBA2905636.1 transcriptional pleiotropic regulator of transition state genes [Clostridium saccha
MKTSGIIRNVDPLGRVVIPKEMRKVMGINEGDPIEIVKVNNDIVMRKYSKGCIFCGSDKEIVEFNKVLVCRKCKQALKED